MRIEPLALNPPYALPRQRGLGVSSIYALFVCWTLFAVFVYSKFSQLGDAQSYLLGAYDEEGELRTVLVTRIATMVIRLAHNELLAHLAFSMFAATGVAYLVRQARVQGHYRWPLLAILLLPNFGVWASVIGRESLFIGLLAFFMGATVGYQARGGLLKLPLAVLCVAGMALIRTPFGAAMGLFLLMFLLYVRGPRMYLSVAVQALGYAAVAALVLAVVWHRLDGYIANEVLPKARSYFTIGSATTRTWVHLDTTGTLLKSLWWTMPLSLLGPTPGEAVARPVMLPFLASGLAIIGLLGYSIVSAFKAPAGAPRKLLVLGWLPAVAIILVAYVPFGVYNPGSGIRYASCFLLFLIYPSMLLSSLAEEPGAPCIRQGLAQNR
ncbi:MAG: hypothetical protein HOQ02_03175 [Lysobacter sp.]|nr:hypothetical protein [Lysobacter sp.]